MKIKTALLSVSNKDNIIDLAKFLARNDVEIISTGGTAKKLIDSGIEITPIEKVTGNPEAFDGRMKTISFQIGSALLYKRDNQNHIEQANQLGIPSIDLVVCNLYPFDKVAANNEDLETLIENIDIGGPTMIRAAAKNFQSIAVLSNPNQYKEFMDSFENIELKQRKDWALNAFEMTARYDVMISQKLNQEFYSEEQRVSNVWSNEMKELRYGENPHQDAFFLPMENTKIASLSKANILQGKALSYNNMLDADAAWKSVCDAFYSIDSTDKYAVSVIKHLNPCGLAVAKSKETALEYAWKGDPVSAFGGIIAFSYEVDGKTATWFNDKFIEILMAPSFSTEAKEILSKKKNLRLIELTLRDRLQQEWSYRSVAGGMLIQQEDTYIDNEFQSVTKCSFAAERKELSSFGLMACKHLKSNAIALVHSFEEGGYWLAGAGMGQPNRIDSLRLLASERLKQKNIDFSETILISDAFFPFRDSVDIANEYNIKFIVQPGGSIRDNEVIEACDEHGIAMVFTGKRHFRH